MNKWRNKMTKKWKKLKHFAQTLSSSSVAECGSATVAGRTVGHYTFEKILSEKSSFKSIKNWRF